MECIELVKLIEKYYPNYFNKNSVVDYKFEQHLEELIKWIKNNGRKLVYPRNANINEIEKFSDGSIMYEFLFRKSTIEKIVSDYKDELRIIKKIYPSYGITKLNIVDIKMKEIYEKFYEYPENLNITSNDKFEIDGSTYKSFLTNQRDKIIKEAKKHNKYAIWIVDKILNKKSHFISPREYVDIIESYCETFKEWPKEKAIENKIDGLSGKQLYIWLSRTSKYISGNFIYEKDYPGLKERLDLLKKTYQIKLGPVQYVDIIELYCKTFKEWPKKNVTEKQIEGLSSKQLYEWLSGTSKYISGNFIYEKDYPGLKERLDVLKFHYSKLNEYKKSKQEYEDKSRFEAQKQIAKQKENVDGRKLS